MLCEVYTICDIKNICIQYHIITLTYFFLHGLIQWISSLWTVSTISTLRWSFWNSKRCWTVFSVFFGGECRCRYIYKQTYHPTYHIVKITIWFHHQTVKWWIYHEVSSLELLWHLCLIENSMVVGWVKLGWQFLRPRTSFTGFWSCLKFQSTNCGRTPHFLLEQASQVFKNGKHQLPRNFPENWWKELFKRHRNNNNNNHNNISVGLKGLVFTCYWWKTGWTSIFSCLNV